MVFVSNFVIWKPGPEMLLPDDAETNAFRTRRDSAWRDDTGRGSSYVAHATPSMAFTLLRVRGARCEVLQVCVRYVKQTTGAMFLGAGQWHPHWTRRQTDRVDNR